MGFFLILILLSLSYLSPEYLYPEFAAYHVLRWMAIIVALVSLPALAREKLLFRAPQTFLLIALFGAMLLSHVAHSWFGGIFFAADLFLPQLVIFFMIALHVNTWNRARLLAFLLIVLAIGITARAMWDLYRGNLQSPFIMVMGPLLRIRGVGVLSDPNDLAQFLMIALPLVWLAWAKGKNVRNFFLVILPSAYIVFAMYLTHSRGAMLAVLILTVVILRRRVPLPISAAVAAAAYVALMALGFTGGREVSLESGADRIELWGNGLAMFKHSPLWGAGAGKFGDFASLTAHNSYVLCLAEIGLLGYTLWLAAVVVTLLELNSLRRNSVQTANPAAEAGAAGTATAVVSATLLPSPPTMMQSSSDLKAGGIINSERIRAWATALALSFLGFLVTAWFLSRSYTITLYVLLGMGIAVLRQAGDSPQQASLRRRHWFRLTICGEIATIIMLYAAVRMYSFFG